MDVLVYVHTENVNLDWIPDWTLQDMERLHCFPEMMDVSCPSMPRTQSFTHVV